MAVQSQVAIWTTGSRGADRACLRSVQGRYKAPHRRAVVKRYHAWLITRNFGFESRLRYMLLEAIVSVDDEFLNTIEEKDDLLDAFMYIDQQIASAKWLLAKQWMFGSVRDLTDEELLIACGLEY